MSTKSTKLSVMIGCGILCVSILISPAAAYVDPSVMTYAIQAIAGVVIVLGVTVGVVWRRMKKKAQKVLHIDENAKKEVEDEVVEFSEDAVDGKKV